MKVCGTNYSESSLMVLTDSVSLFRFDKTQAAQAHNARSYIYIFLNLYANVQRAKRDTVTADICNYITTEFGYAKT